MKGSIISLLAIAGLSFAASAQTKQPLRLSVKAGLSFPKITASRDAAAYDGGSIGESSVNTSFYFGATVDLPLGGTFVFQPGFSIIGKGTKAVYSSSIPNSNASGKINLLYFEIPADFVAYIPAGKGRVFLGLGPYLGIALSGTAKYTFTNSDEIRPDKENIRFGDDRDFKRYDFGGNALVGYQFSNRLNIHGGLSRSFQKISNSRDVYLNAKNLVYTVGIGFSL